MLPSKLVRASFQVWNMLPPAQEAYQALYLLNMGGMRCNHLSLTLEGTEMREGMESPQNFSPTFWSE